jgi:hypothetical protein
MADTRTVDLAALTGANLAETDIVCVVDVSDTTMDADGTDKYMTLREFSAGLARVGYPSLDPRDAAFGAECDCIHVTDGAITATDATLTSASNRFYAGMVGQVAVVLGAGTTGATHVTTVASYTNAGSVELTAVAGTTVTGAYVYIGTDDTTAIQAWVDACNTENLPGVLPEPALLTGVLDLSGMDGLTLLGFQPFTLMAVHGLEDIGPLGASSLVFTSAGASTLVDLTSSHGYEIDGIGFVFVNSALTADPVIDCSQPVVTRYTQGRFSDCLFAMPEACVADGTAAVGMQLDGVWGVSFDRCAWAGFDEQIRGASSAGNNYSNTVSFNDCFWGGYGTIAIRYPGECWNFNGGHVHRAYNAVAAAAPLEFIDIDDIAADISVMMNGVFFSDIGSSVAAGTSVIKINAAAGSDAECLTINGGRSGGNSTAGTTFVEFLVNSPMPVHIGNVTWTGGPLVDFNTSTGVQLSVGFAEETSLANAWYTGTFPERGVTFVGPGHRRRVQKGSNESVTSSAAVQSDDALLMALPQYSVWDFELNLLSDGGAGGFQGAFTVPASATITIWGGSGFGIASTAPTDDTGSFSAAAAATTPTFQWGGSDDATRPYTMTTIKGTVTIGATAGNLQFQWAQHTSNGTASTIRAGSWLVCERAK